MALPLSGDALYDSALEPFGKWVTKPNLEELVINQPCEVGLLYRRQRGEQLETWWRFERAPELTVDAIEKLCRVLANKKGHVFDPVAQPRVSTRLPGGHRFEAMMGKAVTTAISVTVRVKRRATATLEDFGLVGPLRDRVTEAVASEAHLIVSGGTSSGKTTFLNLLLEQIPSDRRLFVMEDTEELEVSHKNVTRRVLSRNETGAAIGYPEVFDNAMRSRPDHILLGELSVDNTQPALRLLNSGHRGLCATLHADSPELALDEAFFQNLALAGHRGLDPSYVATYLRRTVDLVVQVNKVGAGRRAVTHLWWPQAGEMVRLGGATAFEGAAA